MPNMIHALEKLWKQIYRMAIALSKPTSPYNMINDYQKIFDYLDQFKHEAQRMIEMIRKNLLRSRPTMPNRYQLEEYIKRIEFANEIIFNLDIRVNETFNTYIEFINIYWDIHENLENYEQQKILSDKYDMSLIAWQGLSSRIERFNELTRNVQ